MSKRRRGFPSETHVKRGVRIVRGSKELVEKLGRKDSAHVDPAACFKKCCLKTKRFDGAGRNHYLNLEIQERKRKLEKAILKRHFEKIGARVKFRPLIRNRWRRDAGPAFFTIDIDKDKKGSYFDIAVSPEAPEFEILQTVPKERHLLLYSRDGQRFLCGHDERHWFVAPVGGAVSSVRTAKQSLLPPAVWDQVKNLSPGEVDNRKNAVFKRQGEWFFLPTGRAFRNPIVHRKEPLQRTTGSKPHICQELIREGGELVYIVQGRVYSEKEYKERKESDQNFDRFGLRTMIRDPEIYVRGYVRHPDHATIRLNDWHRVFINAELTTSSVTFLD
jgi:hypothetical protein